LKIVAELTTPIEQHLLIHPNHKEDYMKSRKVFSHPHALAQCHKYLRQRFKGISLEQMSSTSAAAHFISEHPEENLLAIGNELAAEQYGLLTVVRDIHDHDLNYTKFIVLAKSLPNNMVIPSERVGEKTTIFVTLPLDRAGALHQVLSAFAWRKINLTKIESRPLKTELGQYFFTIDIDQKWDDILLPNAVKEIETLGCKVKMVGSYQTYRFESFPLST
jgi:prephenate dehydratase